jgi:sugar O-acyltransferase (sialic acid O-acetyltransferase NeuD family)
LLILGAGGHGRVVADAALEAGYREIAFLDDQTDDVLGGKFQVVGKLSAAGDHLGRWKHAALGIGNNATRLRLFHHLKNLGFLMPSVVHPSATASRFSEIGEGSFVAAGVVINTGAVVGSAVILNTAATIDHDCVLAEGAHVSPGAHVGGSVTVGARAWLGLGSAVKNGVAIGDDAIVGAGAVVISDVAPGTTVVGVPARTKQT